MRSSLSRKKTTLGLGVLVTAIFAVHCSCHNEGGGSEGTPVEPAGPAAKWTRAVMSADWSPRRYGASVVLNGRMWLVGGSFMGGRRTNAVWSSADGRTWTQVIAQAPWQPRSSHALVVHDGKMWLLGGYLNGSGNYKNDVWSSSDGVDWQRVTEAAAWAPRRYFPAVSFNGRMWLFGGYDTAGEELNDVWSSTDGLKWMRATEHADWPRRAAHSALVHQGKMWVLGGSSPSAYPIVTKNDVWSSLDGVRWTLATKSAPWVPRRTQTVLSHAGRMWLMGGRLGGSKDVFKKDVWSSEDGIAWQRETDTAPWSQRRGHTSVVLHGRLWIIGGANNLLLNDVWYSEKLR